MTVKVNIDTKNLVKIFTIAVLFVVAVAAFTKMYDALVLIATSLFFALALNPAVSLLSRYMPKNKRGPAVFLVMVTAFALLSVLVFSIIKPVASEATAFADTVPQRINELNSDDNPVGRIISKYHLQDEIDDVVNSAKDKLQQIADNAVNRAGQFGNSFITSLTGFVITVLMLLNGPVLLRQLQELVYQNKALKERHEKLLGKMYGVVTGYVNGQVLVALIASLVALGALFVLKIPYPLPLAAIVFVFGLIPLIGNTIAATLVVLFALILKDLTSALILIAYFVIYQQIENATLQPMVQGKTTQLPTLVIFLSVILGVALMGPIGGLFAIPAVGCARVVLLDYLSHRPAKAKT